jgi:pilus assembly protein CpaB
MKNTRALIVLGLALLAGLAAVVLAARWLTQRTGETAQLVVAARDIDLGTPLDTTHLTSIAWPGAVSPEGSYRSSKELDGRVLKTAVARGEPILESKLAPKGTKGGLAAVIPAGKRAITVRVNEVVGVAGFALPGSFVDVMVHTTLDDDAKRGKGAAVSKIVLERILVLAVAQEATRDATKPRVVNAVTLEVTPEQAELLDVARSVGSLSLVLRNQIDQNPVNTAGTGKADLFAGAGSPAAPAASAPSKPASAPLAKAPARRVTVARQPAPAPAPAAKEDAGKVEVIRGVSRSTVEL